MKSFLKNEQKFQVALKNKKGGSADEIRNKAEYGDFQTPLELARRVCRWIYAKGIRPEILVEPTFGQGNFIIAALETFDSIESVYGVEIYERYFLETQRKIEEAHFDKTCKIHLFCDDVFRFSFSDIAQRHSGQVVLVLGNPPWVTNSLLGTLESTNIPHKSNYKNIRGIEALTGKGNFDLGESITFSLLKNFADSKGCFAFLVKNSVIKNIVHAQRQFRFGIGQMESVFIDAKKEFNAAVDAKVFFAKFREKPSLECSVFDSFHQTAKSRFGWVNGRFVSNIEKYEPLASLDGRSPEIWRQGVKHDCSSIMELMLRDDVCHNKIGETVDIENNLLFPLLKSSDLKKRIIKGTEKFVLIPQKFIGQKTDYIAVDFPKTFSYLDRHREFFDRRKSSIYRGKPPFSIFGIGDYSFKPYKIAISGLYKQSYFSLILPQDSKPVMLDDTCYFLGFDAPEQAVCVHWLLNHEKMQNLLHSLVFWEGKRVITKEILMRLDYGKLLCELSEVDFPKDRDYGKIVARELLEEQFEILRFALSSIIQ